MTRAPDWVLAHARRAPEAPAVDAPDCRLTYGELASRMSELAAHLADRGVGRDDRVLVVLAATPASVAVSLAVQALGACVVEVDRATPPDTLATVLRQTGARHAVAEAHDVPRLRMALGDRPLAWLWVRGLARPLPDAFPARGVTALARDGLLEAGARGGALPPRPDGPADAPAVVVYTSGSTGAPRGVIQTFRNVAANSRSIVEYLALGPSDRAMAILPFHYCYGRSVLQTHLLAGGSVFVDPRFMFPRVVMEAIAAERCTGFAGVPLTFELLRREVNLADIPMPTLRYVTQAGGAMRSDTVRWARAAFAPARLFVMYGQTEATARLAYVPPERGEEKLGSIGVPIPGVELEVVDEAGRAVPPGEVGHLVARGDNVTPGYLGAPEETAAILHDGWLWTGDLARRDADGFLFLVGRAKEILKVGGHRVSPLEIEDVIADHPAVAEVVVVGAEDPVLGEVAVAYVVPRPGAELDETAVRRYCRERLPPHKVPGRVEEVEMIPRNGSGKPLRAELKARASARRGADGVRS